MSNIRVRFAPSPTGALHIGGVRTALYNYLFAKKHGGTFVLRIEDTDQGRYVPGAEEYILESLGWCGIMPTEGQGIGGPHAPYRQSERKETYLKHALELVANGSAYYAFDTPEELEAARSEAAAAGNHNFKYDATCRQVMKTSLTLSADEVQRLLDAGEHYVIRLKVPENEVVTFTDLIRGEVSFHTSELDDKVLMKSDGMPTYHLANIVDDHLMEITHVIRGEEWLPSTGHHVLLYRAFGWEATMPQFSHLPLILRPDGKGKLSKRDGAKFGMPVFPLSWPQGGKKTETAEDSFEGFREFGFLPQAVINFLAFLGWNPGTEQEIFSLEELCEAFSLEKISKSGARFDYDKAKWYNQQYLHAAADADLAAHVRPLAEAKGYQVSDEYLAKVCHLMKGRATFLPDLVEQSAYLFGDVQVFDNENIAKRWKPESRPVFEALAEHLKAQPAFVAAPLEEAVKAFMADRGLKPGEVMPVLRLSLAGTMQGPGVYEMMELLGNDRTMDRLEKAFGYFDAQMA
ncbi:MAG: glutamate--tRNA ligase [Saprospiraceae bacterium]|nr:glutamate--tRNA ligase [Saprospiraceae bacterium]